MSQTLKHFLFASQENGGVQVIKEKPVGHLGVPFNAQTVKTTTEIKPFSFDEREKERIQRHEEKIKEVLVFLQEFDLFISY